MSRSTLREFWKLYPDAEQPLKAWYDEVSRADWEIPETIIGSFWLDIMRLVADKPNKTLTLEIVLPEDVI